MSGFQLLPIAFQMDEPLLQLFLIFLCLPDTGGFTLNAVTKSGEFPIIDLRVIQ